MRNQKLPLAQRELRRAWGVGVSRGTEMWQGHHAGWGAGKREKHALAASYGAPYQQPHGRI